MTKYLITILAFLAALAGLLLWVGDDIMLSVSSSATSGLFAFAPLQISWQFAILAAVVGTLLIIGLWSVFLWLWRLPRRVKSGVGLRRRNRALDAMEEALLAGAEGDVKKARKKAEIARSLIGSTELGRVISALSAEAAGDSDVAVEHYQAMLKNEKPRVLARLSNPAKLISLTQKQNGPLIHFSKQKLPITNGVMRKKRWGQVNSVSISKRIMRAAAALC